MATTITWGTKVINVFQADLTFVSSSPLTYELDMDVFRLDLKDLEDSEDGMMFPDTHTHNPPVSISGTVLARVVEIINGYTVTFEETGTPYRVQIVGGNTNIGSVINLGTGEVSVSTSNSAGLQDLKSLQAATFNGEVSIDVTSSNTGKLFPTGTRSHPVNNTADALLIAEERGFSKIKILESMTLTADDFSDGFTFEGDNAVNVVVTLNPATDVSNCTFLNMTLQGTIDGGNVVRDCNLLDITSLDGFVFQCALNGMLTIGGSAQTSILSCYSGVAGGASTPTVNMGGSGQALIVRDYHGGLKLTNRTGTDAVSVDIVSGQLILDSTVSAGEITVRGHAKLTDNSTGTATVDKTNLLEGGYLTLNNFVALR